MKLIRPFVPSALLTLAALSSAHAKIVFYHGFESYAANANIGGQPVGATTWSVAGLVAGDQAIVSTTSPQEGAHALFIADNGSNRPRASVDLIAGGFVSSAISAGSFSFWVREDTTDSGAADLYTVNASGFTLSRNGSNQLVFSISGGTTQTKNFSGTGYSYTPGSWNLFKITFDNVAKTGSLYVNGGLAATVTGATANFAVSGFTLGTYSSTAVGDKVYFDGVEVIMTGSSFANGFDTYAAGSNIHGQPAGATTWTATGLVAGDLAIVSADFAYDGAHSLLLADNGSNRPRASVNFVSGGFIPAAATGGTVFFAAREDPNDSGAPDSFTVNISGFTLSRDPSSANKFIFSITGGSFSLNLPFVTDTYTYTPGQWNTFELVFDNAAQTGSLYINDGYAGSLTMAPGVTTDFKVSAITLGTYSSSTVGDKVYFDAVYADFNGAPPVFDWRSTVYPANWTPGYADSQGRFLHDFSYAGYKRGEVPLPSPSPNYVDASLPPYNADKTGTNDATAAIQSALDAVGSSGGGTVYLPAGTYKVAPPGTSLVALQIKYNNVVLRGAGASQTFLLNTSIQMRTKKVVAALATNSTNWFTDDGTTNTTALSQDILGPTFEIPVVSTTGFAVGDLIMVRNDLTSRFVDELGHTGLTGWTTYGNRPGLVVVFARRITAINTTTKRLTVDIPIRFRVLMVDNGRVTKPTAPMLTGIGVEDLSIGMKEHTGTGFGENDYNTAGTAAYDCNQSFAVYFQSVENSWVRRVNTFKPSTNVGTSHVLSNAIKLSTTRNITVDSCQMGFAQYKGGGGNGYIYTMEGEEALIVDCRAEDGRHNIDFGKMHTSGNVFLRFYSKNSKYASDFHQYLSMSNLLDNTTCDGDMLESRFRASEGNPRQGQTTTQSVFWNTNGLKYGTSTDGTTSLRAVNSHQFERGYVIGTQGPAAAVVSTDFVEGVGMGTKLIPASLYTDQLARRLAP